MSGNVHVPSNNGAVTPQHTSGRIIAAFVMLEGIAFVTIIVAAITSTFVARAAKERERAQASDEDDAEVRIEGRLDGIEKHLGGIDERLDRFEKMLRN
jgi:hypothetical protein